MSKLTNLKNIAKSAGSFIANKAGSKTIKIQKYSPEILMGVGVVGIITATVLVIKKSGDCTKIIETHQETKEVCDNMLNNHVCLPDQDEPMLYDEACKRHDMAIQYRETIGDLTKLYALPVSILFGSIGCILWSQKILKSRNAALLSAYNLMATSYTAYREKMRLKHGNLEDTLAEAGIEGNYEVKDIVSDEETQHIIECDFDPNKTGGYSRFFDEASPYWEKDAHRNNLLVRAALNKANNTLQIRGYVYLNDIYEDLGIPTTKAGSVIGWVKKPGDPMNKIDFGLWEENQITRDFVNGIERSILLTFNPDGIVYDLL